MVFPRFAVALIAFAFLSAAAAPARGDVVVYADALATDWQDWSWGGVTRDYNRTSPVHSGSASLATTYTAGWSGLQLGYWQRLDVSAYDTLRFFVHGGSRGGQTIDVAVGDSTSATAVTRTIVPAAGTWTQVDVSLLGLGATRWVSYISWTNNTAGSQPVFFLDDVAFLASGVPTPTPLPTGAGPSLSVDAAANRHTISPYIYGMNFADEDLAADLQLPVRRWGGNATTRYNWQTDSNNHASDWFFENLPNDNANPAALPDGAASDQFIEQNARTDTDTVLTIPLIGWTPKDRVARCGFSVSKYGAQQSTDPWMPDCGNGVRANGTLVTGNDPLDTSTAITPAFVQAWMSHLMNKYGSAAGGGVRFYNLDNEPELWDDTHRDVHPAPTSYDEMRDRTFAYAAAVKATDPSAQTLGPVPWGWSAYFWSALDWAPGGAWWDNPQDRLAHGDVPFVEWYLQQLRAYEQQHGTRILDYLDVHYYPQATGVSLASAGNTSTQALRLRSTRSLWDPTYTDESWIGEPVRLVPRLHEWVNADYPSTKLAITEYNWGGLEHINGALAQADVLGIFGREGLDLATLWSPPTTSQPGAFAFRMYRSYDGSGGRFGDVSVSATSSDQGQLALYAAQQASTGQLTLIIINKTSQALMSGVSVANFTAAASAAVYRYSAANLGAIVRAADQVVSPTGFTATFPSSSITLVVLLPSGATPVATPTQPSLPTATATPSASLTPTTATTTTPTRTVTPNVSFTPTTGNTGTPTRTATPLASFTSTPASTATSTRTPTPAATRTPSRTPTLTPASTATQASTPTRTATATRPPTATRTRTNTPAPTPTKGHKH